MTTTISVFKLDGGKAGQAELPEAWFAAPVRPHLIHSAVVAEEAAARQGTHATKTRGDVSGGGKKPWKQKGTGRARQGSTRSPIWRHGGTVFGPQPRDYSVKVNKQERRAALAGALSARLSESRIIGLDPKGLDAPKTQTVAGFLKKASAGTRRPLFVHTGGEETLVRSVRNLKSAAHRSVKSLSVRAVMLADLVVLTSGAIDAIKATEAATAAAIAAASGGEKA